MFLAVVLAHCIHGGASGMGRVSSDVLVRGEVVPFKDDEPRRAEIPIVILLFADACIESERLQTAQNANCLARSETSDRRSRSMLM